MNLMHIALVLIVISAVFQGFALRALSNKSIEMDERKKKYNRLKLIGYAILMPAVALMIVDFMS